MHESIDIFSFTGTALTVVFILISFLLTKWIFSRISRNKEKNSVVHQSTRILIVLIGALAVAITLPIKDSLKGQIIGLIGIVLSAAFALSSTTLIGNALAGLMNTSIRNLNLGALIKTGDIFGRVTKRGLFRTEIQTEDRNLTSIPNLFLATNPVKVMRDSGTIISTTVSLGYDLNRDKIETALIEAAKSCGLEDPFVYVTGLGDYSVSYKINGLLKEVDKYFTFSSKLNVMVMDYLHRAGIEIVSPRFMNQRQVNETVFIPEVTKESVTTKNEKLPEELVFDKAIKANKIDDKIESLEKIDEELKQLKLKLKDATDKEVINKQIKTLEEQQEKLRLNLEDAKKKLDEEK